jgi:hypothetical protein
MGRVSELGTKSLGAINSLYPGTLGFGVIQMSRGQDISSRTNASSSCTKVRAHRGELCDQRIDL